MNLAYLPLFVVGGMALDWAFFERMRSIIGMFRPKVANRMGYRDQLWPRIVITIFASLIVGIGSLSKVPNAWLIVFGGVMFSASNFYVDYKYWRDRGRE